MCTENSSVTVLDCPAKFNIWKDETEMKMLSRYFVLIGD